MAGHRGTKRAHSVRYRPEEATSAGSCRQGVDLLARLCRWSGLGRVRDVPSHVCETCVKSTHPGASLLARNRMRSVFQWPAPWAVHVTSVSQLFPLLAVGQDGRRGLASGGIPFTLVGHALLKPQ